MKILIREVGGAAAPPLTPPAVPLRGSASQTPQETDTCRPRSTLGRPWVDPGSTAGSTPSRPQVDHFDYRLSQICVGSRCRRAHEASESLRA